MTYKPFDLSGKVVVVTGGNKGIGLGMVEALAASNADVVIWGRKTADNDAAVKSASKLGTGKVKAWVVDVGEEDQVVKAMKEAEEEFKRIDACIANAGVGRGAASFETMTLDTWRYNQRINAEGAFFTLREAAKSMVTRAKAGDPGGSLVGTASLAGIEGAGRNQAYAHTKGGLIAMMNACAVEYGRYGIRANSVLPGWIATDMTEGAQGNDVFATKVITRVPIRRWGEPADFGGIAVYLASDASKYHSGDTLVIDGGYAKF
ncbi:SDR family oxidoreductase [Hyphomonas sp.]|uniref:SDR family NAD(P)-dependent oxidoreductase n=1 Tax=Hyphomonas sp. TaxID=87 RepID=UPI0025B9D12D|nr:SDR family oxidoreductase [Hyphomonas sp.]